VTLYAGSSGFSYDTWRPGFYPAGSKTKEFLSLYAERLPSVELNTSGYKLPSEAHFEAWAAQTPPGFRFAVKMSRRITHFGAVDLIPDFCRSAKRLGDRLGPILVQIPENRPRDDGFLRLVLDSLDPELAYAFELRHESWDAVDVPVRVNSLEGEGPLRYLRLREPPYDEATLRSLADGLRPVLARGVDVYAYFKHEDEPTAPEYALRLLDLAEDGTTLGATA
jgi:uncharacterized protein YecE (DUF72 family)